MAVVKVFKTIESFDEKKRDIIRTLASDIEIKTLSVNKNERSKLSDVEQRKYISTKRKLNQKFRRLRKKINEQLSFNPLYTTIDFADEEKDDDEFDDATAPTTLVAAATRILMETAADDYDIIENASVPSQQELSQISQSHVKLQNVRNRNFVVADITPLRFYIAIWGLDFKSVKMGNRDSFYYAVNMC
jgi:hypothetical protein